MIQVYCILLVGEPILLYDESASVEYGFYRNEYVLSFSPEKAIAVAKANVMKKLSGKPIALIEGRPIQLKVEKVTSKMPLTRLFRNEGFLFFPT